MILTDGMERSVVRPNRHRWSFGWQKGSALMTRSINRKVHAHSYDNFTLAMQKTSKYFNKVLAFSIACTLFLATNAQNKTPLFKVIAFYTAKNDLAHISFVNEANKWFPAMGKLYNFSYDSTSDWGNLNET